MGNRTLSHPGDPTVSIHLKLPLSLKIAVDELGKKTGKSTGELFREWATSQVGSYEIELVKIEQEELKAEFELKSIRAHKLELQAEVAKQQITNNTRFVICCFATSACNSSLCARIDFSSNSALSSSC